MSQPESLPLVTAKELQKTFPFLGDWQLFRLRKNKLIPFIRVGHRSILYDPVKVRAALDRLEVKELT
jgi:hypothetical protein